MMIFKNRQAAGKLLAARLKHTKADLVLGIPRGGVVVAFAIAKKLKLPLDIIVTRKIGAPYQKELALGAVDPDGQVVSDEFKIKSGQMADKIDDEINEIKRREKLYRQGRELLDVENKIVILVDDGLATGLTMISAISYLKRHGAKDIILAVPVASYKALEKIEAVKKEVLYIPEFLQAVGQFYQNFEEVSDEKVIQLLNHE